MEADFPDAAPLRPDEVMFSPAVRAAQEHDGSRAAYARRASAGAFGQALSADTIAFIEARNSAYLATASADGQPYMQHRGGPAGFIKVLDLGTLAFADYAGNRQHISAGHLAENPRAFLFLMDYRDARRLKLWGRAQMLTDPALAARVHDTGYGARMKRTILFSVQAWDWNCSQHIPRLVPAE
jgi:predicted pyridoxine 5'-phosphate oxidase superfamily flavin-nucleotide-binding protein